MPGIDVKLHLTLKPGDKVRQEWALRDFHPIVDSKGRDDVMAGGAGYGASPCQIMCLTKTLNNRDRVMNYFYGARAT